MIYRQLNPIAKKFGFKVLIFDNDSYQSYSNKLNAKLNTLSLSKNAIAKLNDAMSNYSFVAVLRSDEYVPYDDAINAFNKFGMKDGDLKVLSTKYSENMPFGSFDDAIPEQKRSFFYWFPIEIEDVM